MKPIYLDYNATTPIDRRVVEAMRPYFEEHFGNPSSSHAYGLKTRQAIKIAREQVADAIGASVDEIIFTGSGSESNNTAILGAAYANRGRGRHIITSAVEHPAVMEVCHFLQSDGFEVTVLPVDISGRVSIADLKQSVRKDTILISIMHANNEVGTIQPIEEIGAFARQKGILFHSDGAQSVGKIPVNVNALNADLLTIAGHKLYTHKGIGALYIRRGTQLPKLIHGAGHEGGRRAGTENVMQIVGLGMACRLISEHLPANMAHLAAMRDLLQQGLVKALPDSRVNGHPDQRLPNTLSMGFADRAANDLMEAMPALAVSAGAACHSDKIELSATLKAMQVPLKYAMGTIRFSTGLMTTAAEIDQAIKIVTAAVKK